MSARDARRDPGRRRSAAAPTASTTSRSPRPPSVAAALDPTAYDVVRLTIDPHGTWLDAGGRPIGLAGALVRAARRATCCCRSCTARTARTAPSPRSCDLAGVPYVGSGVRAGALAMDKWATKLVAGAVGVATAPGVLLTPRTAARHVWTHPVVVKPVAAGSSHGVSLVAHGRRPARPPSPRRSPSTTGCWSRTSSSAARSTSPCSAAPTARASWRRRSRSWSTGSSTTRTSTAAAPTSASRPPSPSTSRRRWRTPPSRCTTRSAAPASPGSTSS